MKFFDRIINGRHYRKFIDLKISTNAKIKMLNRKKPDDQDKQFMYAVRSVMESEHTSHVLRNIVTNPLGETDRDYICREMSQFLTLAIADMPESAKGQMLEYMLVNHNFLYLKEVDPETYELTREMVEKVYYHDESMV